MAVLSNSPGASRKSGASSLFDLNGRRVFVAGHRGMVGSAIVRCLAKTNCTLITVDREKLDLLKQEESERFLNAVKPEVVIIAAARVGGIQANSAFPADFIRDNLVIATNLIHGSFCAGVRKLMFLGSSCVYPRLSRQPIVEEELLSGPLEPTNEWYAIAKIAGIKLCQAYRRQHGADYISAAIRRSCASAVYFVRLWLASASSSSSDCSPRYVLRAPRAPAASVDMGPHLPHTSPW